MSDKCRKECEICHELFPPDSRVGKRQHVCNKLTCRLEKKRRYNQQWRARKENSDYYKGRYPYLKDWLQRQPDYLKNYRAQQKSISEQHSRDIQVELNININNGKRRLQQSLL